MYKHMRELRIEHNLTKSDLASMLHIPVEIYDGYERSGDFDYTVLEALADYYLVSTDYILDRTDCRVPYPAP